MDVQGSGSITVAQLASFLGGNLALLPGTGSYETQSLEAASRVGRWRESLGLEAIDKRVASLVLGVYGLE
jgi:hypothetical protein